MGSSTCSQRSWTSPDDRLALSKLPVIGNFCRVLLPSHQMSSNHNLRRLEFECAWYLKTEQCSQRVPHRVPGLPATLASAPSAQVGIMCFAVLLFIPEKEDKCQGGRLSTRSSLEASSPPTALQARWLDSSHVYLFIGSWKIIHITALK